MDLRWAIESDYDALGRLMLDAVREGESLYSQTQRRAWAPAPRSGEAWRTRLAAQHVVIAEGDSAAQGFMSIAANGYIDFAYIRPAFQRTGLFRRLFDHIEAKARDMGLTLLSTHASLMAQPAFAAMGFTIIQRETVALNGVTLDRFEMEKRLAT